MDSQVALKIFTHICAQWNLSDEQRLNLFPKSNQETQFGEEDFTIVSNLMRIHRAVHTMFGPEKNANYWVHKPNQAFDGRPAIQLMCESRDGIALVADHLDFHCNSTAFY